MADKSVPLSVHIEHDTNDRPSMIYTYYRSLSGGEVKHGSSYHYHWDTRTREVHRFVHGESIDSRVEHFDRGNSHGK